MEQPIFLGIEQVRMLRVMGLMRRMRVMGLMREIGVVGLMRKMRVMREGVMQRQHCGQRNFLMATMKH